MPDDLPFGMGSLPLGNRKRLMRDGCLPRKARELSRCSRCALFPREQNRTQDLATKPRCRAEQRRNRRTIMDPINTNIENDLRALRDDELDTISGGSDTQTRQTAFG